jgi:hypothetical protein
MKKHFKQGPRVDIGPQFFRSSWEANIGRLLTHLGVQWRFEPHRFWFDGTHSYLPDFRLDSANPWDVKWLEVKGKWNPGDKVRLRLFAHFEPKETFHVLLKDEYLALEKQYKDSIPNWEGRIRKFKGKKKKEK